MNAITKIKSLSVVMTVMMLSMTAISEAKGASTDAQAKRIESVLDRLEKRLIDKESSPLTSEESERIAADAKSPVNGSQKADLKYVPKTSAQIKGQTQTGRNVQELQKKLNEYDSRIEILESDMRKLRSNMQETGETDNLISIQIKTDSKKQLVMKTLAAVLDGNTLYNQIDPAGLWIPSKVIPLYYGPLKPGMHKLEISATLSTASDEASASGAWKQKALSQSFEISVPEGKQRKSVTVEIVSSSTSEGTPVATLYDAEAK